MKKIIFFLFVIYFLKLPVSYSNEFWSNKIDGPRSNEAATGSMTNHINCYSFALKPEEHQPSGTCNFSRIDNARMVFESHDVTGGLPLKTSTVGGQADQASNVNIYAVNYNVLRIMSGMGGLAYSN